MPLSAMLFSFAGRLNRARFWLANIVLFMVGLVLAPISSLSWTLIATSPLSIAALVLVSFANLSVMFSGLAVAIKRLHDRDKPAWWLLLFYLVPWVLLTIAYYTAPGTGAAEVRLILVLASLSIAIWYLVELGFLRGTAGPNRYGPDPLQTVQTGQGAGAPARFATIALLTLSGAVVVAELLTLSGVVVVAESALPLLRGLVHHGRGSGAHFAISPRIPAAPNEAQRQPQPPGAPNEAQDQPQLPAEPDQGRADLGEARFVNIGISGIANSQLDWLLRPPRGDVKFDGIPFTILSGDRSVIHMHNRVRSDYPSTLRFPIGVASVASVHLLLCGDWISNPGQHVGTVRISYSDGSSRDVPLISLEDIRETWMPNFSLTGHPSSSPPEGVTWNVAYSESQMRGGMASTAFLDRLSIRTDPARTINEVSFLTSEPQTGMILIAMTLELTSGAVPSGAAWAPAKPDQRNGATPPPAVQKPDSVVTGVWTAHDVGFPPWTLTLKADGGTLSGAVQQGARGSAGYNTTLAMPAAIYDGEIDGNKVTFKCQDPWTHDRTITFTGILNGDAMSFTRTVVVKPGGNPGGNGIFGASGAAAFTAQRLAPTGAASAPAKPDQDNGAQPPAPVQKPDIVRGSASAAGRK
jgi:uncharacterized membrane protein YhaH (DUF805 family)